MKQTYPNKEFRFRLRLLGDADDEGRTWFSKLTNTILGKAKKTEDVSPTTIQGDRNADSIESGMSPPPIGVGMSPPSDRRNRLLRSKRNTPSSSRNSLSRRGDPHHHSGGDDVRRQNSRPRASADGPEKILSTTSDDEDYGQNGNFDGLDIEGRGSQKPNLLISRVRSDCSSRSLYPVESETNSIELEESETNSIELEPETNSIELGRISSGMGRVSHSRLTEGSVNSDHTGDNDLTRSSYKRSCKALLKSTQKNALHCGKTALKAYNECWSNPRGCRSKFLRGCEQCGKKCMRFLKQRPSGEMRGESVLVFFSKYWKRTVLLGFLIGALLVLLNPLLLLWWSPEPDDALPISTKGGLRGEKRVDDEQIADSPNSTKPVLTTKDGIEIVGSDVPLNGDGTAAKSTESADANTNGTDTAKASEQTESSMEPTKTKREGLIKRETSGTTKEGAPTTKNDEEEKSSEKSQHKAGEEEKPHQKSGMRGFTEPTEVSTEQLRKRSESEIDIHVMEVELEDPEHGKMQEAEGHEAKEHGSKFSNAHLFTEKNSTAPTDAADTKPPMPGKVITPKEESTIHYIKGKHIVIAEQVDIKEDVFMTEKPTKGGLFEKPTNDGKNSHTPDNKNSHTPDNKSSHTPDNGNDTDLSGGGDTTTPQDSVAKDEKAEGEKARGPMQDILGQDSAAQGPTRDAMAIDSDALIEESDEPNEGGLFNTLIGSKKIKHSSDFTDESDAKDSYLSQFLYMIAVVGILTCLGGSAMHLYPVMVSLLKPGAKNSIEQSMGTDIAGMLQKDQPEAVRAHLQAVKAKQANQSIDGGAVLPGTGVIPGLKNSAMNLKVPDLSMKVNKFVDDATTPSNMPTPPLTPSQNGPALLHRSGRQTPLSNQNSTPLSNQNSDVTPSPSRGATPRNVAPPPRFTNIGDPAGNHMASRFAQLKSEDNPDFNARLNPQLDPDISDLLHASNSSGCVGGNSSDGKPLRQGFGRDRERSLSGSQRSQASHAFDFDGNPDGSRRDHETDAHSISGGSVSRKNSDLEEVTTNIDTASNVDSASYGEDRRQLGVPSVPTFGEPSYYREPNLFADPSTSSSQDKVVNTDVENDDSDHPSDDERTERKARLENERAIKEAAVEEGFVNDDGSVDLKEMNFGTYRRKLIVNPNYNPAITDSNSPSSMQAKQKFLHKVLGQGSCKVVYLAEKLETGEAVAWSQIGVSKPEGKRQALTLRAQMEQTASELRLLIAATKPGVPDFMHHSSSAKGKAKNVGHNSSTSSPTTPRDTGIDPSQDCSEDMSKLVKLVDYCFETNRETEAIERIHMITRLFAGGTLRKWQWCVTHNLHPVVDGVRLDFPVLTMATQLRRTSICVAQALRYLHTNKIIHRDVRPDNIFIKASERTGEIIDAVLADLGLFTHHSEPGLAKDSGGKLKNSGLKNSGGKRRDPKTNRNIEDIASCTISGDDTLYPPEIIEQLIENPKHVLDMSKTKVKFTEALDMYMLGLSMSEMLLGHNLGLGGYEQFNSFAAYEASFNREKDRLIEECRQTGTVDLLAREQLIAFIAGALNSRPEDRLTANQAIKELTKTVITTRNQFPIPDTVSQPSQNSGPPKAVGASMGIPASNEDPTKTRSKTNPIVTPAHPPMLNINKHNSDSLSGNMGNSGNVIPSPISAPLTARKDEPEDPLAPLMRPRDVKPQGKRQAASQHLNSANLNHLNSGVGTPQMPFGMGPQMGGFPGKVASAGISATQEENSITPTSSIRESSDVPPPMQGIPFSNGINPTLSKTSVTTGTDRTDSKDRQDRPPPKSNQVPSTSPFPTTASPRTTVSPRFHAIDFDGHNQVSQQISHGTSHASSLHGQAVHGPPGMSSHNNSNTTSFNYSTSPFGPAPENPFGIAPENNTLYSSMLQHTSAMSQTTLAQPMSHAHSVQPMTSAMSHTNSLQSGSMSHANSLYPSSVSSMHHTHLLGPLSKAGSVGQQPNSLLSNPLQSTHSNPGNNLALSKIGSLASHSSQPKHQPKHVSMRGTTPAMRGTVEKQSPPGSPRFGEAQNEEV